MSLKVLLVALAVVAAFGCSSGVHNAAFYKRLNKDAPVLLQTPEILSANEFCPNLEGKSSCCNADSLAKMQEAHAEYSTKVRATFMNLIEKSIAGCDKLDALDQTSDLGYKFERLRADTIVALGKHADKCQEAAIEYTRSVQCMTCDAELVDYTENGKTFVDESDLVNVHESCSAFFTESKKFEATLQSHETRLRSVGCKKHTLHTVDTKTVTLCVSEKNTQESFRRFVTMVGQAMFNKFEIAARHEIRYSKNVISVCDDNGCETQRLSTAAEKIFGDAVNTHFVEKANNGAVARNIRHTAIRKNTPSTWEDAVVGGFFDAEAFTAGKKSPAVIELVEEGGYRPVERQAKTNTTTTTTTTTNGTATNTTTNVTAGPAPSPGLAGNIKDKLSNVSGQIDAYYQTSPNTGVVAQVMFAVLTIATTALLI